MLALRVEQFIASYFRETYQFQPTVLLCLFPLLVHMMILYILYAIQ